jgi:adenosylcobinamide-GDP ribazoletransferase
MRVVEAIEGELRGALGAVAFLTCLPVGRAVAADDSDLARGVPAFPLVGAGIGAAAAECGALLAGQLPAAVAGSVALALAVVLTGGLHVDGLADTADSLGGRSTEEALAIMRDARVGSYGATAIALLLIVEAAALATLVTADRIADVVVAFALSRAVAPLIATSLPYARPGPGLARALGPGAAGRAAIAGLLAIGLVPLLEPRHGWELAACAGFCGIGVAAFLRRRLGGMTGDALGAAIALTEVACLVVSSAR